MEDIDKENLPKHIAIIMDGNRRWAKDRELTTRDGHKAGAQALEDISKFCNKIGINPNNDGKVIRLAFPELNEERRKELVKEVKKMAEDSKVSIRSIRREAMDEAKKMQKDNLMTEDELKSSEDKIQKLTDNKISEIDKILSEKEKEIMSV